MQRRISLLYVKKQCYDKQYMRQSINRRKRSYVPSLKRFLFLFFFLLFLVLIVATCFYSVPIIYGYLAKRGYISPLASKLSLHDALGNTMTLDEVNQQLQEAHFSSKSIEEFDNGYIVTLQTGEKVIFSKKKPLNSQISSLQLISSRLTIEGKHFVQLDLRFDRPVLVPK
jgi:hypothetical protein